MKHKKRRETKGVDGQVESIEYFTRTGGMSLGVRGLPPSKSKAYDKSREVTQTKGKMPIFCEGRNVLRLEVKLCNRAAVKKLLGGGADIGGSGVSPVRIEAYDLTSKVVYDNFKEAFLMCYNDIEKTQQVLLTDDDSGKDSYTLKDIIAIVMACNRGSVNSLIADLRAAGKLTKENAKRVRRYMRSINTSANYTKCDALIEGLDKVIQEQLRKG